MNYFSAVQVVSGIISMKNFLRKNLSFEYYWIKISQAKNCIDCYLFSLLDHYFNKSNSNSYKTFQIKVNTYQGLGGPTSPTFITRLNSRNNPKL